MQRDRDICDFTEDKIKELRRYLEENKKMDAKINLILGIINSMIFIVKCRLPK